MYTFFTFYQTQNLLLLLHQLLALVRIMNKLKRATSSISVSLTVMLLSGCIESHQIQHDTQTHKVTIDLHYSSLTDISSINNNSLFIVGPHGSRLIEKIEKRANNQIVVTTHPLVRNRAYKLVSSNGIKWISGDSLPRQSFHITPVALVATP